MLRSISPKNRTAKLDQNLFNQIKQVMVKQILFSGHMIDAPNREVPRFPAHHEKHVKKALGKILSKLQLAEIPQGICSAAAGGDILFLEHCKDLGIPTKIFLPTEPAEFRKESVDFAGKDWPERFNRMLEHSPVFVLDPSIHKTTKNIYTLTNEWMIEQALQSPTEQILLIALWNGKKGDGGGGTWEMVEKCRQVGIKVEHLQP